MVQLGLFIYCYEKEVVTNPGTRLFNIFQNQYDIDNLMELEWSTRNNFENWISPDMDAINSLVNLNFYKQKHLFAFKAATLGFKYQITNGY